MPGFDSRSAKQNFPQELQEDFRNHPPPLDRREALGGELFGIFLFQYARVCGIGLSVWCLFTCPFSHPTTPRSRCETQPIEVGDLPFQRRFPFRLNFTSSSSVVDHEPCPLQANCRGLTLLTAALPDHQASPGKPGWAQRLPHYIVGLFSKKHSGTLPSPTNKLHDRVLRTAGSAADHIGADRDPVCFRG